jgi:hypothetical protein
MSIDPWIMEAVNKGDCFIKVKGRHTWPQTVAPSISRFSNWFLIRGNGPRLFCYKYSTFLLFLLSVTLPFFCSYFTCLFLHMPLSSISTILFLIFILSYFYPLLMSRDSSVGIATGYGLDDGGVGVRVPVGSRIFFSPRRPDRLWGPPSLLSNRYRGREADHSPPLVPEVKKTWIYTSTPPYAFMS